MKTYKLCDAVAMLAKVYAMTESSVREDYYAETRLVTIHQGWNAKGKEYACLRLARGRYKGNEVGRITRADDAK